MTQAFEWSNAELGRVYAAAYQGRAARLCLAQNPGSLTKASTTSQWDAAEITGQASDGYARVTWTVPSGAYNATTGDFRSPVQVATFQADADGFGLTWDTVYLVFGTTTGGTTTWDTHVAGIHTEIPAAALAPGQPRTYRVFLSCDDAIVLAG